MRLKRYIFLGFILFLFSFKSQSFKDSYSMEMEKVNQMALRSDTAIFPFNPHWAVVKYSYSNSTKIAGKVAGFNSAFMHIEKHEKTGWTGHVMFNENKKYYKVSSLSGQVVFTSVNKEDIFQE